jgi:hypothetical protein
MVGRIVKAISDGHAGGGFRFISHHLTGVSGFVLQFSDSRLQAYRVLRCRWLPMGSSTKRCQPSLRQGIYPP